MPTNLSPEQKAALKNLLMIGAFYLGIKAGSALARYAILGYLGFTIFQASRGGSALQGQADGWGVKIDPSLAVDLLFPKMKDSDKIYAKMAAGHVLEGLLKNSDPIRASVLD